jgi:hypothetical protein
LKQALTRYLSQLTTNKGKLTVSNVIENSIQLDDAENESIYAADEDEFEAERRNNYEIKLREYREEIECSLAMRKLLPEEAEKAYTWIRTFSISAARKRDLK